ncbi:MAG TPA: glucokinase [Burkholderiaceae bacterium]|jgi:glucokinase|nr:glucokinase [Burkholderiaceae bacterium]
MEEKSAPSALVADLGGTNVRFALAQADRAGRPRLNCVSEFAVLQFASLSQAAEHYLARVDAPRPRRSVIAVASAVTGDRIRITNNPWSFSIAALKEELGLDEIHVINDFAAIGRAVPHLEPTELSSIGSASPRAQLHGADRHYAILGPGTGLGVCRLMLREGRAVVIESEGSHIAFAPGSDYEIAILQHLMKRRPRVSVERLISGPGLHNLYQAICAIDGMAAAMDTPESITAGAREGTDAACARAVELFCAILGSFAGDVALMFGAWDGVYLGGGLTGTLLPWICAGAFRRRFEDKGRFSSLMQTIPTSAIAHAQPGLLGAGAWAFDSQPA